MAETVSCMDSLDATLAPKPGPFRQGEIAADGKRWKNHPCGCSLVVPRGQ
jgi:hypothetical protein